MVKHPWFQDLEAPVASPLLRAGGEGIEALVAEQIYKSVSELKRQQARAGLLLVNALQLLEEQKLENAALQKPPPQKQQEADIGGDLSYIEHQGGEGEDEKIGEQADAVSMAEHLRVNQELLHQMRLNQELLQRLWKYENPQVVKIVCACVSVCIYKSISPRWSIDLRVGIHGTRQAPAESYRCKC
jgi:hypothetical protein